MQLKQINPLATSLFLAVISFAGASRFHGCYYFLTVSAIIAILINSGNKVLSNSPNLRIYINFLCVYSGILLYSGFLRSQSSNTSLAQILLGNINLPLLFVAGFLTFKRDQNLRLNNRKKSHNTSKLIAFSYCIGAAFSSLHSSLMQWATNVPTVISTIRPSELLYSIGICLLSTIFVSEYTIKASDHNPPKKTTAFSAIIFFGSIANLFLAYYVFKGITSLVATATLSAVISLNFIFDSKAFSPKPRITYAIIATTGFFAIFAFGKEAVLRYALYPFISGNTLNGRTSLILSSINALRSTPLIGHSADLQSYQGIWTHNFYLDTILQHGYVACVIIVAFISYFLFNLRLAKTSKFTKTRLYLISMSLFVGSLAQPIEFSDGIAFQLSFFVLGSIAGIIDANSIHNMEPMNNVN